MHTRNQIKPIKIQQSDDIGMVFVGNAKIYRKIFSDKKDFAMELMVSGLIDELVDLGLFPQTQVTKEPQPDNHLMIEHHFIKPLIYPEEWTLSMLKDAAILMIKVRDIAYKYGYNIKDGHSENILFIGTRPIFIDFGSFVKFNLQKNCWISRQQFLNYFYYPLKLSNIFPNVCHYASLNNNGIKYLTYLKIRYGTLRALPFKILSFLCKILTLPFDIKVRSYDELSEYVSKYGKAVLAVKNLFDRILINKYLYFPNVEAVEKIKIKREYTSWAQYHNGADQNNHRFIKIIELINKYCTDAKTSVDIAGNQGFFSRLMLQNTSIENCFCIDVDENALDIGYCYTKTNFPNLNLSFSVADFMNPIERSNHISFYTRYSADLSICLALTHHLILSQKYNLKSIVEKLADITKKYLVIEFMPNGIWAEGDQVINKLPSDYNIYNFIEAFKENFIVIDSVLLEANRHVLIMKRIDRVK